jgi:hypothetical protein
MRAARKVKVTLGVGVALLVAGCAVILTQSPLRVVRSAARATTLGSTIIGNAEVCQPNELLPAGVSAIRLSVGSYFGPKVRVRMLAGSRVITEGTRGPVWTGTSVTVPVKPLRYAASHVRLCMNIGPNTELVFFRESPAVASEAAEFGPGASLGGKVGVEDLALSQGSWWSRIGLLANRMSIGHALTGTWVVWLIAALVAAVAVLAVGLVERELP